MAKLRKGNRPFYDDRHFPMGFNRSGDFTIPESKLLTEYGLTLQQLTEGSLPAESEDESHFVQVFSGQAEPLNAIEKVWLKYLKVTSPQAYVSIYGKNKPEVEDGPVDDEL